MRTAHGSIAASPRSSPSTSFVVSAYASRKSGSPKFAHWLPKPPTNPFTLRRRRSRRRSAGSCACGRARRRRPPRVHARDRRTVGLPIVIAEHSDEPEPGGRGTRRRRTQNLVDLAVLGEVAGEQDQIALGLDTLERLRHAVALRRAGVDVAGRRHTDRSLPRSSCTRGMERPFPVPTDSHGRRPDLREPPESDEERSGRAAGQRHRRRARRGFAVYARGGPPTEHDVDFIDPRGRRRARDRSA